MMARCRSPAPSNVLSDGAGGISLGCDDADYAGVAAGDIVVALRGTCDRVARAIFGQAHGAAAVILVNNGAGLPPFEGHIGGVTIPFVGVASSTDTAFLAADGDSVTITATTLANPGYQHLASFSSGGPAGGTSGIKPDVTAPGVSVVSTGVGTGTGGATISGTSMASPLTAGTAALVLESHPGWLSGDVTRRVDRVKAALMGTADDTTKIVGYSVRRAGAGVVDASAATAAQAMATTADHTESLAFGYQPLNDAYSESRLFTVWNESGSSVTYDLSSAFVGANQGAELDVNGGDASVSVPAGGSATVEVTLSLDADAVAALSSVDTFVAGAGVVPNIEGTVSLDPEAPAAGIGPLHVPFLIVPRGISDMTPSARTAYQSKGTDAVASTRVTNNGIHDGSVEFYAWGLSDPVDQIADSRVDIRAAGVEALPGDLLGSTAADRGLIFALNMWGRGSTAARNVYEVWIDTDQDGFPDFVLQGADVGLMTAGVPNGILASALFDSITGLPVSPNLFLADAPMNGSTVELAVLGSDLGLDSSHGMLSYTVDAFDLNSLLGDFVVDFASFDAFNPALSSGDFVVINPGEFEDVGVTVDTTRIKASPALGWMAVGTDNGDGAAQADLIPIGKPTHRLAGADRYATAAAISRATFDPGVPFAFVASGANFPDGLSAGPAAAHLGGPVLLVPTSGPLPPSVTAELTRLQPNKIIVVGGLGAVSDATKTALQAYQIGAGAVQRLAGTDRYATAAAVSAFAFPTPFTPGNGTVYVASGVNFPDALSGGPAAAHDGGPLLLVPGSGPLPTSITGELARLHAHKIVVIGGTGSVSNAEMSALNAFAYGGGVSRISGSDRYATSAAVSEAVFDPGVPAAYVASGLNFPDALGGGAAAGFVGAPVLLVKTNEVPSGIADELMRLEPDQIYVLGGIGSISDIVANSVAPFIAP